MTRDAITEDISSSVAVKAVWLCEGRSTVSARRQREVVEEEAIQKSGGTSAVIQVDFTGRKP
jgi:hypothetical protein